jgi:excisionase family DNA binding protein
MNNRLTDNETLLLKIESHERRIEIMEDLLRDSKQVLTLEEAALYLGISKSSIYKMTHKHELPFYRPNGKLIYFEKEELLKWMRQNRNMSEAETQQAAVKHMNDLAVK